MSSLVVATALLYPRIQDRIDAHRFMESVEETTKKINDATEQAKIQTAKNELSALQSTADMFVLHNGRPPKNMDELSESSQGVIEYLPLDPWGYPYIMRHEGNRSAFKSEGLEKALAAN